MAKTEATAMRIYPAFDNVDRRIWATVVSACFPGLFPGCQVKTLSLQYTVFAHLQEQVAYHVCL